MRKLLQIGSIALASLAVAGCPRPVRPPAPAEPVPAPAAPDTRGATLYTVNAAESLVLIHVYRGGTLARLGHNHVAASKHLSGRIWLHPTFTRSGFELSFPVAELIVDDPKLRAAAGPEFQSEVKPADKEGTRKNMLRAEVLDAERYPEVRIRSVRMGGGLEAPQAIARITIRDASRDVEIPAKIAREGGRLRASGAFDVKQSDFGMKPFSVGLGALEVQDRLHIRFDVVADKRD
jgi:polyisoprenoid-binding protein YceI